MNAGAVGSERFSPGDAVRFAPLGPEALRNGASLGKYERAVGTVVRWEAGFWVVRWPGVGERCCYGPALEKIPPNPA